MTSSVWTNRMRQLRTQLFVVRNVLCVLLLTSFVVAAPVDAQTTTGSVRGVVTSGAGEPAIGATVSARNVASGLTRSGLTNDRGYYVLLGLVAGDYEITARRVGSEAVTRRQQVQIGQSLTLDISLQATTTTLAQVQVTAAAPAAETRTSEIATNVSSAQIENLPTSDRNFLTFAQLAPGVRVTGSGNEATSKSFSAGAQPSQNVNIFIDGASLKSDVLPSGLSGQDASRGNPFPQNAVQEFRVITQNYKAEYQKATSAIITATTKSGSNHWEANLFGYGQGTNFTALDTFALNQKGAPNSTFKRPSLKRYMAGGSIGGPLVQDKLFMFASYETNIQDRANTVRFGTPALLPDSIKAQYAALAGTFTSPFRSHLLFGKLTLQSSDKTSYEASYSLRHETDIRSFGNDLSYQSAENVRNDVNNVVLKRTFASGNSLHETLLNFSRATYNPSPEQEDIVGRNYFGAGRIGGRETFQKFIQDRLSLRHDFTYTGLNAGGEHVIKVGGNVDALNYDVTKFDHANPVFQFRSEDSYAFPFEALYGKGDPNITRANQQVGVYVQDDYSPIPRLTINAGVRWDYETNQFDNDHVTPSQIKVEAAPFNVPASYFSTGNERKPFLGAVQPRLGISYAIDQAQRTTLFAGAGIFYDRNNFNNGFDERFRLQFARGTFRFSTDGAPRDGQPTVVWQPRYLTKAGLDELLAQGVTGKPDAFLINNETRPPSAVHYNAGIRQLVGAWQFSLTFMGNQSKDGFTFIFGNRRPEPNAECCVGLPSFGNILLSSNAPKTWYSAVSLQANRPYQFTGRDKWNWGAGVTYTAQKAERIGGDLFSLDYRRVEDYPRTPSANDVPNTVVGNWILDIPVLGGIQWSGLLQLNSGARFTIDDQSRGGGINERRVLLGAGRTPPQRFLGINAFGFRNVDMRLRKDIPFPNSRIGIVGDLYNVFNFQNLGCFDGYIPPTTANPNLRFGKPGCTVSDSRRAQIGLVYDFR